MAARLAVVTVVALGLYITAFGLPFPGACTGTGAVAGAAPSPTCGSDLRECLHLKAKTGLFGVRYVTAEDVATCTEAFNSCIHRDGGGGGGGGGGKPPASTTKPASLPNRFGIDHGSGAVSDCRRTDDAVACAANWNTASDTYNSKFTGTASGLTMAGTTTTHRTGQTPADPGCTIDENYSGPTTYVFDPDGRVEFTAGPNQRQTTLSGSCSGGSSGTTDVMKGTATWSATR